MSETSERYWTCSECGGHYFGRPITRLADGTPEIDYTRIRCDGTDTKYCGKVFPDQKYKGEKP